MFLIQLQRLALLIDPCFTIKYLMTIYASNAGKSGGEFFTPADVSELLTRLGTVGKTEVNKVYEKITTKLIRLTQVLSFGVSRTSKTI